MGYKPDDPLHAVTQNLIGLALAIADVGAVDEGNLRQLRINRDEYDRLRKAADDTGPA